MADIRGDLAVVVVKGINLQNLSVFGACNPYILVKLRSSLDSVTTSVKDGEDNPTWQDTFTFRGVSGTDELQISLMEKEGEREGVVSVASYIPSTMWGFPGTGGAERELKVVMPSTAGRKANRPDMGTVVLRLQYHAELPFRSRFNLVKAAASKTGEFTKKAKIDVAVDKILSLALKPANMATGIAGCMTKKEKLISGGAVAVVGAGASMGLMVLAVTLGCLALLFLPLTVMGGFFLAMVAMMVIPVMMVIGWVVLCSRPVQCRLWMPALFWAVATIPNVKKVLIRSPTPGTEQ